MSVFSSIKQKISSSYYLNRCKIQINYIEDIFSHISKAAPAPFLFTSTISDFAERKKN